MKKIAKLFAILALALMCLTLTACGGSTTKAELAPYLSVTYTGYNGNGEAHVDFDFSDFEYSIMSQWKDKEKNWEKLAELTAVEMTIHYEANVKEGLSNGDTITVTISLDEKLAKEKGYSFTGLKQKFTVEGLTEPIKIDPFDDNYFAFSLQGNSPFAYLEMAYIGSRNEPQAYVTYQADRQYDLKNGDVVTITASMSERYTRQGYLLTRNEMTLTVEGLQSYITDVSALSSGDMSALRHKAEGYFTQKLSEDWLNMDLGWGTKTVATDSIGAISALRFSDTGYAVVQNGWGVTAAVILPYHVDLKDIPFSWWNNTYYDEPLIKTFNNMSGYMILTDLQLDAEGQLIRAGSFGMEMSDLFETEQQMMESITNRFGFEGMREGTFAE
ncbi:MAG: hypothetical protein IKU68_03185 [Oscillospiraceae bacterium]|nr:hypothetical protein [Oscillospiraceae bacterium]